MYPSDKLWIEEDLYNRGEQLHRLIIHLFIYPEQNQQVKYLYFKTCVLGEGLISLFFVFLKYIF